MPPNKPKNARPRDPKTGWFLPNPDSPAPKRKRKSKPKKTVVRGPGGRFMSFQESLAWEGGDIRKNYIIRSRFEPLIPVLQAAHDEYGAISPDELLDVWSHLSGNHPSVLKCVVLYFPSYAQPGEPTEKDANFSIPKAMSFIGLGMQLITDTYIKIRDGWIFSQMEPHRLRADSYLPERPHPLWEKDEVTLESGETIKGDGVRNLDTEKRAKRGDPYDRKPKKKRDRRKEVARRKALDALRFTPAQIADKKKADRKRWRENAKAKAKAAGKKPNKGNVKEQRKRRKQRQRSSVI